MSEPQPGDRVQLVSGESVMVQSSADWRGCVQVTGEAGECYAIGISAIQPKQEASTQPKETEHEHTSGEHHE